MERALLEIKNLKMEFLRTKQSSLTAINGISLSIKRGEVLGLVGESGSGKSITSLSILQLLPRNGHITQGEVLFEGKKLPPVNSKDWCQIRGNQIAMIFQDPMVALDPMYKCGYQIMETILQHEKVTKRQAMEKTLNLLDLVGIPQPESYVNAYPHELSGGMCQRIMIAIALACNPKLLIADEPTTALDVTVQAQILDLLRKLKNELNMSILLITHDLGVVAETADRVAVMYAGEIMEEGGVRTIFKHPSHPYTQGLIRSTPRLEDSFSDALYSIKGTIPRLSNIPEGCRFRTRCPMADDRCLAHPECRQLTEDHWVQCCQVDREAEFA